MNKDGGVDDEQHHHAHKVLPVRRPAVAVGERDGHHGRAFHHPRQRVPHETEELPDLALLEGRNKTREF
jgi:hypothetical protein